jgi:hypothetical protein
MNVIKSEGGYYYKVYKSGKKKRISKHEYLKVSQKYNPSLIGGDNLIEIVPDLLEQIFSAFNVEEGEDKENLRFGLKNYSELLSSTYWKSDNKFRRSKGINSINTNVENNIISECNSHLSTNTLLNNNNCNKTSKCERYYSGSKQKHLCVPKNSIKNFRIGQGIMGFDNNPFKIITIIEVNVITIGKRNIILLKYIFLDIYLVIFPCGSEEYGIEEFEAKIQEIVDAIKNLPDDSKILLCGHSMGSSLAMATSLHKDILGKSGNVYLILTGIVLYFNSDEFATFISHYKGRYLALNIRFSIGNIILIQGKHLFSIETFKDFRSKKVLRNRHPELINNFIYEIQVNQFITDKEIVVYTGTPPRKIIHPSISNISDRQLFLNHGFNFTPKEFKYRVQGIINYETENIGVNTEKINVNHVDKTGFGYSNMIHMFEYFLQPIFRLI